MRFCKSFQMINNNEITILFADDALEANELVTEVFKKYHQLVVRNRSRNANVCLISTPNASAVTTQNGNNKNTMDELHEIFASSSSNASHSNAKPIMTFTPLEPTPAAVKTESNGNFCHLIAPCLDFKRNSVFL